MAEWCSSEYCNNEFCKRGLNKLLPILEKEKIKATFFVTGHFAGKEPAVVKSLYESGHEVACHSQLNESHRAFSSRITHSVIKQAKKAVESAIEDRVKGFRMPLQKSNKYYLGIISSLGFRYDSTSNPAIMPGRIPSFLMRTRPYFIKSLNILEIPVTLFPVLRFPLSSSYFRNLGNIYSVLGVELNALYKDNIILYFYPWDFIDIHKIKGNPFITRNTGPRFIGQFKNFLNYMKKSHSRFDVLGNLEL